jgi:hypothetical protein
MEAIFAQLVSLIQTQQSKLTELATKIEQLEWSHGGGGGGTASIEDYESGKQYTRNMLIVDPETETVYRALTEYTSDTVANDIANGFLKLVGYESQVVTFSHDPTQTEINNLPDDTLVAVYSPLDSPYTPSSN